MAKSIVKMRGQGCKDCRHTHYFSFILVISGSCEWKILKEIQLLRLVFVSQKCQDEAHKFGHFWELKRTISKQDSNTEACCRVCCKNASRTRHTQEVSHYFSFIKLNLGATNEKFSRRFKYWGLLLWPILLQKCKDQAHKFGHFWESQKEQISKEDSNTEACCRVCCKNASRTRPRGRPAHKFGHFWELKV